MPTKAQLQDHTRKFGKFTVRAKYRGSWERSIDGSGRYKTREEAERRRDDLQKVIPGTPVKVQEEDDGLGNPAPTE